MDNTKHWESLATGRSGAIDLEKAWLRKVKEVFEVFCDKQRGYGPNNIAQGGTAGVVMRSNDKLKRMFQLTFKRPGEEPLEDETLRDTAIDIADYYIIWLMVNDGDWPEYEEDFLEPILKYIAREEWSKAISLLMEQLDTHYELAEEYDYVADDLAFDADREKRFFG